MSRKSTIRRRLIWVFIGAIALLYYLVVRARQQTERNRELVLAVKSSDFLWATELLREGADPNAQDRPDRPTSPWEILTSLFSRNKPQPADGPTCLHLAQQGYAFDTVHGTGWHTNKIERPENVRLIQLLLESGADCNRKDPLGETPLLNACYTDNWSAARLLVDYGAQVNQKGKEGWLPILVAAIENKAEIVTFLLDSGAEPNVQVEQGDWTPLTYAIFYYNEDMLRVLLKANADPRLKPKGWMPPLEYALYLNAPPEIIRPLEKALKSRSGTAHNSNR